MPGSDGTEIVRVDAEHILDLSGLRTFELEIPDQAELVHRQIQLWLTVLVILASGGPLRGTRLGSVAVGTDLLVQVQEIE